MDIVRLDNHRDGVSRSRWLRPQVAAARHSAFLMEMRVICGSVNEVKDSARTGSFNKITRWLVISVSRVSSFTPEITTSCVLNVVHAYGVNRLSLTVSSGHGIDAVKPPEIPGQYSSGGE